jgi:hypothetical protein
MVIPGGIGGYAGALRLLIGAVVVTLVGCARDYLPNDDARRELQLQKYEGAGLETKVFLQNLTGVPTRAIRLDYKPQKDDESPSLDQTWQADVTVEKSEEQICSLGGPDRLLLEKLKVTFPDGSESEFSLDHACKPGDQVLLILDIAGRLTVKTKE